MSATILGHVVVVTGGAGRIGRAFCDAIAREGATVVVADTNAAGAADVAERLCARGRATAALPMSFDITEAAAIDTAITQVHDRFGRIDAVVNNAYPRNANYGAKVEAVTYADFAENVSQHVGGYFLTAQRFAAYFRRQGRGNIVFMSSIYGIVAPRFDIYAGTEMTMPVEYAVIKAGLLHLTRYLAQYLKQEGIRVNALSPGGVFADQPESFIESYTKHAAGKRMLAPADLAGALLFLLSPASAHVTGQNIVVDDGWTL